MVRSVFPVSWARRSLCLVSEVVLSDLVSGRVSPSGRAGGVLCGDPVKGLSGRYGYGPLVQGVWGHMEVLRHLLHGLPVEAVGAPHG